MLDHMVIAHLDKELDEEELRTNVFIFFLAGHETTATALAFILQVLAKDQTIQEKMRKEVLKEIGNEIPTYENVKKLDFMAATIKENLRLYGPVTSLQRVTKVDTILEDWILPAGTNVMVNMHAVHTSKESFEDPEQFKPERWLDSETNKNNAWIPFGSGSRICVGNNFSILEQKIFLSVLLQKMKWEFKNKEDISKGVESSDGFLRIPQKKTFNFHKNTF